MNRIQRYPYKLGRSLKQVNPLGSNRLTHVAAALSSAAVFAVLAACQPQTIEVEIPVTRIVEVPVETVVEKPVEVIATRVVEKQVEVAVTRVVEKQVEVVVTRVTRRETG